MEIVLSVAMLVFLAKWGMLVVAIVYAVTWLIVLFVLWMDNRTTRAKNVSRGGDANLRVMARKSLVLKMRWFIVPTYRRTGASVVERDTRDPLGHH